MDVLCCVHGAQVSTVWVCVSIFIKFIFILMTLKRHSHFYEARWVHYKLNVPSAASYMFWFRQWQLELKWQSSVQKCEQILWNIYTHASLSNVSISYVSVVSLCCDSRPRCLCNINELLLKLAVSLNRNCLIFHISLVSFRVLLVFLSRRQFASEFRAKEAKNPFTNYRRSPKRFLSSLLPDQVIQFRFYFWHSKVRVSIYLWHTLLAFIEFQSTTKSIYAQTKYKNREHN